MGTGKIIAAFGIPGSGKSSVMEALSKLLDTKVFHEPEEDEWGPAVRNRKFSGNFTAIMWFRSIRVPQLFLADQMRAKGKTVLLDSYYDKLFHLYMSKDGVQWLFEKSDEYYNEMEAIAHKDYLKLPEADYLIFFKVDYETWKKFITVRSRVLDNDKSFIDNCFNSQNSFLQAAQTYCRGHNCKLLVFEQHFDSPDEAAKKLFEQIMTNDRTL